MNNQKNNKDEIVKIPIINIKIMTDEEWNKLAYENYLKRNDNTK